MTWSSDLGRWLMIFLTSKSIVFKKKKHNLNLHFCSFLSICYLVLLITDTI